MRHGPFRDASPAPARAKPAETFSAAQAGADAFFQTPFAAGLRYFDNAYERPYAPTIGQPNINMARFLMLDTCKSASDWHYLRHREMTLEPAACCR